MVKELRPADRIGVAVLPVHQVLAHDRPELRIIQPALIQPIEQRGEPADRHRQQAAAGRSTRRASAIGAWATANIEQLCGRRRQQPVQ